MTITITNSSSTVCSVTEWVEPKMILPTKYTTTVSSLPAANHHHFFRLLNITPKDALFSQPPPTPNTVKVKNEKDSVPEKDSYWLGWYMKFGAWL
jgi:hypothetical protein